MSEHSVRSRRKHEEDRGASREESRAHRKDQVGTTSSCLVSAVEVLADSGTLNAIVLLSYSQNSGKE